MERLRDVLNGTWAGSYGYEGRRQSHRTNTQLTINSNISAGTLKINGGGRDQYGEFTFEGSATSENEISCVKKFKYGWSNNWWHKARVDLDKKEMHGQWGPAIKPNQTDGSLVFQRQMTEEERQQEAAAAAAARRKQEQEQAAREKQEQEEAARKKQEQEEAARKKQEQEEEARKKQEQEEAAKKKQEQEEAAKKKQEQEEAAKKKQEQEEATRKKQEQEKEEAAKRPKEEAPRPQETAQTTAETGKPVVSTTDSEHDIAGNLKIYLKLDLDADIRVIATLKGDIALGIQ